jgi:hypothetical protein
MSQLISVGRKIILLCRKKNSSEKDLTLHGKMKLQYEDFYELDEDAPSNSFR